MRKLLLLLVLTVFFSVSGFSQTTITLDSTVLEERTVIAGLDVPWEMIYAPDQNLWITERDGIVSRINPVNGVKITLLDHSSTVYQTSESGMLGMLLHPGFPDSNYVYLVYTYLNGNNVNERMSRWEYNGSSLVNEDILIDGIEGGSTHDGSRLMLLPDNTILMSTGDARLNPLPSQNTGHLNGKILRCNLDGTVPADNPISGSYVWSWGHRNAQGLCLGPTGIIYSSEHGPQNDDEINILEMGRNYGWPEVEGFCDDPTETQFCLDSNVVEPLIAWSPTIAPSDLVYYDNPAIPEWNGKLLMTVLKDAYLSELTLSSDGLSITNETEWFVNRYGRLRDIAIAPNGTIYLADNGNSWPSQGPNNIIELKPQVQTSLEDGSFAETMLIAPNPASGQTWLVLSEGFWGQEYEIMDLSGRVILRGQANGERELLNLDQIQAGVYLVRAHSKNGKKIIKKLVVQ